ncbi:MAG: glycosyltransferase family 4 protein [Chloroflexi bacterium]|jgi:glycosyltransferase involved in cell wall biosynthesis|nr:glycosyltransferase family 4 protein [Chloroflexota bacterium]
MPDDGRLRLCCVYYEPRPSGQSEHVLSLVRSLDRQCYAITVVIPDLLAGLKADYEAAGARVVTLPMRKLRWPPAAVRGFTAELRREKPHIVHVHSQEAGLVARPLARLGGARRIVYTPHTINIRSRRWQKMYWQVEKSLSAITDRIISINEADRQTLIQLGIPAEKVTTVYNGVDLERFDPLAPPPAEIDALRQNGQALVMQVGRISEQKAPLDFLAGARLVLAQMPDVRFVLVGDGPLLEAVRQQIRTSGLEDRVFALGPRPEAYRYMQAADIITLTSYWEGSPYTLLEAMAWRKPVVATRVNGCPELVLDGETGFLVPPGSPHEWAGRVLLLLRDPHCRRRMGENGRKHLEKNFTIMRMKENLTSIYEQIAI